MLKENGSVLASASAVVSYLGCAHRTTLDLVHLDTPLEKAPDDEQMQLVQDKGRAHEAEFLGRLRASGLVEIADDASLEEKLERCIVGDLNQPARAQPAEKLRLVRPALVLDELHLLVVRRLLERRVEMDEIERRAVRAAEVADDGGRGCENRSVLFQHLPSLEHGTDPTPTGSQVGLDVMA